MEQTRDIREPEGTNNLCFILFKYFEVINYKCLKILNINIYFKNILSLG